MQCSISYTLKGISFVFVFDSHAHFRIQKKKKSVQPNSLRWMQKFILHPRQRNEPYVHELYVYYTKLVKHHVLKQHHDAPPLIMINGGAFQSIKHLPLCVAKPNGELDSSGLALTLPQSRYDLS